MYNYYEHFTIQHGLPKNKFFQFLQFFTESLIHPVLGYRYMYSKINCERMKGLQVAIYLPGWVLMFGLVLGANEHSCM